MPSSFLSYTPDIMKIFRNISNSASSVNFRRFSFKKSNRRAVAVINFKFFCVSPLTSKIENFCEKNDGYPIVSPNGNDCECQGSSDFMSGQQ